MELEQGLLGLPTNMATESQAGCLSARVTASGSREGHADERPGNGPVPDFVFETTRYRYHVGDGANDVKVELFYLELESDEL